MSANKVPPPSSANQDLSSDLEELKSFLASRLVGPFFGLLISQQVDSLDAFAALIKVSDLKASLREAFKRTVVDPTPDPSPGKDDASGSQIPSEGKARPAPSRKTARAEAVVEDAALPAGYRAALAAFDALDGDAIDGDVKAFRKAREPASAPLQRQRYEATTELKEYLSQEGLPSASVPMFEEHGVYSVQSLQDLCGDPGRRDALEADLRKGAVIDGRSFPGSDSAANLLKKLSADDVAARSKPSIQADSVMSEQAQARRKRVEEAIAKVEELRAACAADASADMATLKKRAEAELGAMLERAGVDGALARLEKGAFATRGTLTDTLADIGRDLGEAVGKDVLAAQRKEASLSNDALVEYNDLRRGVLLSVAGVRDACGPELVDVAASVSYSNEGYRESIAQFESESAYQYAEKTVERSSSAFSTSERASGGGIGQAGLFALSMAGSHARARYAQKESTTAGRRSQANKFAVRKIELTCARVRLPSVGARLTRAATVAVARIAAEADEQRAQALARGFIEEFGSHLFRETRLGGCYKTVVKAEALAEDGIGVLSRAASLATGWKASGAATYVGLNFMGSAATANEGEKAEAEGFSKDERKQLKSVRVDISSHAVGGLPGLPADLWKHSLGKNHGWRVVDRLRPVGVWTLLADAIVDGLSDAQKDRVARLLERSWVRDFFLPELLALDPELAQHDALAHADSVEGLVAAVELLMRPPPLHVCCFRKTFDASRTRRAALELPEHYKILSGGVRTLQTVEGNFVVSSYPSYDPTLARWAWHAEMRDIKFASSEEHEITVVAVYDPEDEWDVRLFGRRTQGTATSQSLHVDVETGYLVTGGGGQIDRFGWAVLTQCGFDLASDVQARAMPGPGFRVASRSCLKESEHVLTGIAIGLRPRNGTRLAPLYLHQTAKACAHPDVHLARPDRHERFLGGGVRLHPDVDNFLLGSSPVFDDASGVSGWRAASKDHEHGAPASMTVTLVGVANADVLLHVPKGAAVVREDPAQVCLACGHVGPWTEVPVGVTIPISIGKAQAEYLFCCAACRTVMRKGA
ncbi:hypothetical protein [Marilutibacter spongiae]|uniref:MACPF domain-containing protein n=1 Tax=Marilutibacter spongiae TaxID=2025720 RepID=A0A7W3Y6N2_9GAMM|nr:hypothetical protein [Lysobacter spongiae]MBB1061304.1 hypothetical protein [Lysobacter spongiae]